MIPSEIGSAIIVLIGRFRRVIRVILVRIRKPHNNLNRDN